jgi:predicted Zn-dependent peptidase
MLACLTLLLAALGPAITPSQPQDSLVERNPFADFETIRLANGLKLWYKNLPGDPVVSLSVALPFGAMHDPRGKEQLAHFTEHMLFSDQPGRSEEEIKREIEERGGVYNASVSADRTFYYVRIGAEQALFALEWLHRILAPHAMSLQVVEQQRRPVALEVGARPRQFLDWLWAYYLNPTWLRTPGFWEREFGMESLASRDYYPYASLNRTTPEDLRSYYDTYYVPSAMTLTVIGDVPRAEVLRVADSTFATLPARPDPPAAPTLNDPGRFRKTVFWAYRSNVYLGIRFKFYGLEAHDEQTLIFVSRLLDRRLNEQLRFGERKATYGLRVGIVRRGAASYLQIAGGIRTDELEFAREVVERELAALRAGSLPSVTFETDRAAVVQQLQVASSNAESLESWVRGFFYDTRVHEDFPDLAASFQRLTLADLQDFSRRYLVPER